MKAWMAGLALSLLIGGLAAGTVFWRLAHPPQAPAPVAAGQTLELPPVPALPIFQLPPLEDYSDIVAHPVFIATRLPEPPPEDAPPVENPPANPEPAPALLGVIIMPQATVALLRPEQPGAKAVRIKVGEMVGEWRLEAVFPNRVVLSKGLTKQELALVRSKPHPVKRIGAKSPNPVTPPKAPRAQRPDPRPSIAPPNPPQE